MKKTFYITILSIFIAFTFYLCSEKQNPVNPYNPKYDPKEWMPANLELKQKNIHTVELSWEQVEENIGGFIIDRKIGQQDIQVGYDTLTLQETTYIDTNAAPGEKNTYWIYAYADDNKSKALTKSIEIDFPTPTELKITQNSLSKLTFSWKDNCDGEDGFKIDRKTENESWEVGYLFSSSNEAIDTLVIPNVKYYYRVYAHRKEFNSGKIDTSFTVGFPAPSNFAIEEINISTVKLSWQDNSSGESGFRIDKKIGNDEWLSLYQIVTEDVDEWIDESAAPDQTNYYRLYAIKDNALSKSIEKEIFIEFSGPIGITIDQTTDTTIVLNWTDNSNGEQGFKIDRMTDGSQWQEEYATVSENISTWTDTAPIYGVENNYKIYAYYDQTKTDYAEGSVSNIISPPSNLTVIAKDYSKIELSWEDNCNFEQGFKLFRKDEYGEYNLISELLKNVTNYTDEDVEQNNEYIYRLCAFTDNNQSGFCLSNVITINNNEPTPWFTINPTTGTIETEFTFDGSQSSDVEDSINDLMVRWDFENDGNWETNYSTEKSVTHQYSETGTYPICLEVKDSGGLIKDTVRVLEVYNTPPIPSFTINPESGDTETNFTFDATACSDLEDDQNELQVRWDWENDGIWDTNFLIDKTQIHKYPVVGSYIVKLEVKDSEGQTASLTKTINIIASNTPPVAMFTVTPDSGNILTDFSFDASLSSDDQDRISDLLVRWDFNDDGTWDTDYSTNKIINHQFSELGSNTIRMEVKDSDGIVDDTTNTIEVVNTAPMALYTVSPQTGNITTVFTFNANQSSDIEDDNTQLTVRWDFENDGEWDTEYTNTKNVDHTYSSIGNYDAKLEVKDLLGLIDDTTQVVSVQNTSPTATFVVSPSSGTTTTNFSFDASGCSDLEDAISQLQVRWDWENDGIWDVGYSTTKLVTHQYSQAGSYTVKLEVKDNSSATDIITKTISVGAPNTNPTASFTVSPTSGTTSTVFTFDASGCSDTEDASSQLQVRWDWENDGIWDNSYSTTITTTHTYTTAGIYTVKLEVMDTDGATSSLTKPVVVSEPPFETGTITDIEGNIYRTVKIGEQWWTAENLKVTHYRNGDPIPKVTGSTEWSNLSTGAYCYHQNNNNNADTYGSLYNWYTVGDSRNIAPAGWHVPTDEEWEELAKYISDDNGGYNKDNYNNWDNVGKHLKSTTGWYRDGNGTNDYGFDALPAGCRWFDGGFYDMSTATHFWSASEDNLNINYSVFRELNYETSDIIRGAHPMTGGFSVRCIKGEPETTNIETGSVTDIDGNTYKTVKIGNQWWMAENLKTTHYRNGDPIPNVTDNTEWSNLTTGAFCAFNNEESNANTYGYLYNWYTVDDSRNISPEGWHVPTDDEWKKLEMYFGMSLSEADFDGWRGTNEGEKLKSTTGWSNSGNGTDKYGFNALPAGFRIEGGYYSSMGIRAYFWSASESISVSAWYRMLDSDYSRVRRIQHLKYLGRSIRCVKDSE